MKTKKINLRKCVAGQKLLSCHGETLTYVRMLTDKEDPTPHLVRYANGSEGSRTHDGFVVKQVDARVPEDHNIVKILPLLPDVPSELIELALEDIKKVRKSKKYEIDMDNWHYPVYDHHTDREKCEVCFAGSVMANTLKCDIDNILEPEDFDTDTEDKLYALNSFRSGDIMHGLKIMGVKLSPSKWKLLDSELEPICVDEYFPTHHALFVRQMKKVVKLLKKYDL